VSVIYVFSMVVCGKDFSDTILAMIHTRISSEPTISRRQLSLHVCSWLNWVRPNGKPAEMSCRVALLKLHKQRHITLPQPAGKIPHVRAPGSQYVDVIEKREPICCSLHELGNVRLERIKSSESKASRLWNAAMNCFHYLGAGPLCGAQMRYLITSERHGLLGGMSFSAASWRIAARDRWIGWNDSARNAHLHLIINNSRFLIMPDVRVPHLASHVLSLSSRFVVQDWRLRYGYEPVLLETYVERGRFKGTSYRAANWRNVGQTLGRGRQDRKHKKAGSIKDIYLFPLRADYRDILCDEPVTEKPMIDAPVEVATKEDYWIEEELGQVDLGDKRLEERLKIVADDFFARPQANIPEACGTRAKTKAAYRLFDHEAVTMEAVVQSHYQATEARISKEKIVLAVQDTTELNYQTHEQTEGLGPIGTKQDGAVGLLLHDTMAFTPEGVPLGLLDLQCWARDGKTFGKRALRHELPIEEKESKKWLQSYEAAAKVQKRCPQTLMVSVGDRESDIYELFVKARDAANGPKVLVRARQDRLLAEGQGHLWPLLAEKKINGTVEVQVPRRGNRPARKALLEVRYSKVTLKPPARKPDLGNVTLWAVLAQERDPPQGVEALEWMLLATQQVETFEAASTILIWYSRRWGIEVYHRTLKSGCKIEQRQLGHAERIEACLAIDLVIAWRIYFLTKMGRKTPDVPCTVFFEEYEWKALVAHITQNSAPPSKPPTLREAVRMVASLGGFLGRKGDGEPGTKTTWIGLQRLDDLAAMYKFMALSLAPHLLSPTVSSIPRYG
jgi:hypothetical protein